MAFCKTCELVARRDAGTAPLWDCIHRTQFWDVVHSYDTALPGWLVLVARRHIEALDELTEEEAIELGVLLRQVSLALKEITGCLKTYVIQFAEAAEHPHVHFHIIPRMADQPEDRRSTKIFGYLGVPEEERVTEQAMNDMAVKIQQVLLSLLNDEIQRALREDRLIDIITTGAKSGLARKTEIWFTNVGGRIIICGTPAAKGGNGSRARRDWLANLRAHPEFLFCLKESLNVQLRAKAILITDPEDRRYLMSAPETQWYRDQVDSVEVLVEGSPIVEVFFENFDAFL